MKVLNRLKITAQPLFIGHKLALEDLRKKAKDERHALGIIRQLQDNSDIGQFGSYSKDFPEDLVYYWHIGGKKLTPTINEINDYIAKYWDNEYRSFKDLPSSLKHYFRK